MVSWRKCPSTSAPTPCGPFHPPHSPAHPSSITSFATPGPVRSSLATRVVRPRHRVAGDGPVVNGGWSWRHTVPGGGNVPSTTYWLT
jgi:hypothetical protein